MSHVGNVNTNIPNAPPQEVVIYDRLNNIGNIDFDDNGFGTIHVSQGLIEKCHSIKIEYGALSNNSIFFEKTILGPIENFDSFGDDQSRWSISGQFDDNGDYIYCTMYGFNMEYYNNTFNRIMTFHQNATLHNGKYPEVSKCEININCVIRKIIIFIGSD